MTDGTCLNCNCNECRCDEESESADRCPDCGQEWCECTDEDETPQCMECEETEELVSHPSFSEDYLCQGCLVNHWEAEIEDLESQLESARDSLTEAKKGLNS